jgi:hypothetical protein
MLASTLRATRPLRTSSSAIAAADGRAAAAELRGVCGAGDVDRSPTSHVRSSSAWTSGSGGRITGVDLVEVALARHGASNAVAAWSGGGRAIAAPVRPGGGDLVVVEAQGLALGPARTLPRL